MWDPSTTSTINESYKTCWWQSQTDKFGQGSKTYRSEYLCRRTIACQELYSHCEQLDKNTEVDVDFVRWQMKHLNSIMELRFNLWECRTNNWAKLTRTLIFQFRLTVNKNQRLVWVDSLDEPDVRRLPESHFDTFSFKSVKKFDDFHRCIRVQPNASEADSSISTASERTRRSHGRVMAPRRTAARCCIQEFLGKVVVCTFCVTVYFPVPLLVPVKQQWRSDHRYRDDVTFRYNFGAAWWAAARQVESSWKCIHPTHQGVLLHTLLSSEHRGSTWSISATYLSLYLSIYPVYVNAVYSRLNLQPHEGSSLQVLSTGRLLWSQQSHRGSLVIMCCQLPTHTGFHDFTLPV